VEFPRPLIKPSKQEQHDSFLDRKPVVPSEKKHSTEKVSSGPSAHRVRFRWDLTITVAVSVYTVPFLLVWFWESNKEMFFEVAFFRAVADCYYCFGFVGTQEFYLT
jgi:hypothetical protein